MEFKLKIKVDNKSNYENYNVDYHELIIIKKVTLDLLKQVRAYTEVSNFPPSKVRLKENNYNNKLCACISRIHRWPDQFLEPKDVEKMEYIHFDDSNIAEVVTDMETLEQFTELDFTEFRCAETGQIDEVLVSLEFDLIAFMHVWSGYDYVKNFSLK